MKDMFERLGCAAYWRAEYGSMAVKAVLAELPAIEVGAADSCLGRLRAELSGKAA